MSRNSQKLNKAPTQPGPDFSNQKTSNRIEDLLGLSFVIPTEEVELPTQGKFYPSSSPLSGRKTLEIKSMTAKEEDLLSTISEGNNDNLFNRLIQGLLIDQSIKSEDLHEEDKLALLLSARITGYGDEYETSGVCDHCNKTTPFTFSLRKSSFEEPKRKIDYDPDDDLYSLELPISKVNVRLRKLTDQDLIDLNREKEKKESLNIEFNTTVSKISRMIIVANEISERSTILQLSEVLPAADAKTILNFHNDIYPKLSTKQSVTCQICARAQEREVPLSWAFFRTDI